MASLDFPSSPTNGQTYSSAGITWTYDSTYTVWNVTSSGPVGYSGSQGYTGSKGDIGYSGSLGYTGSKGTDGVIGYNGSNGYNGSQGYTGSGATGVNWTNKSATYTALNNDGIIADTSGGSFTVTLPASPAAGSYVVFVDGGNSFQSYPLTVAGNGSTIDGSYTSAVLNITNAKVEFIYSGSTWEMATSTGTRGYTGSLGYTGSVGYTGSLGYSGSGATGVNWTNKSTTYTAVNNDGIIANTSGGSFTVTLPASPSTGSYVVFLDGNSSFATYPLTVDGNGNNIADSYSTATLNITNSKVEFIYNGSTWEIATSTGTRGYSGSVGYSGSLGYTGSQGYTGSASTVIGYTGSKGDIGYTGSIPAAITATSLALGGATLGTNNLAVTGTSAFSNTVTISGATTLSGALTYGGITLSNAVTGTGNMVLSASPTLTGDITINSSTNNGLAIVGTSGQENTFRMNHGGTANTTNIQFYRALQNNNYTWVDVAFDGTNYNIYGSMQAGASPNYTLNAPYSTGIMFFQINSVEKMRLNTSGHLCVGTTTDTGHVNVGGSVACFNGGTANFASNIMMDFHNGVGRIQGYGPNASTNGSLSFSSCRSDGSNAYVMTYSITGGLAIPGALSKGSGSFRIEHPLPSLSETHNLVHSFIEGPKCDLIYRGSVTLVAGTATINIDTDSTMTEGTFEVLCRNVQCFTTNESDWTPVKGSVSGNILTITAKDNTSTATVSWMVIGQRKDPHIISTDWTDDQGNVIVEPIKEVTPTP